MSAIYRWTLSKWVLAWALTKNILRRLVLGVRGPAPWLRRLASESLGAVPAEAWGYFAATSRCIGCGLCDVLAAPGERPSQWIMQAARRPEDAVLAIEHAARLTVLAEAIDTVCPTRLDARAVARLIFDNAHMLEGK